MKRLLLPLSMTALALPVIAQADQPSYSHIDVGYWQTELDDSDFEPDGWLVRGQFELNENWFAQANWSTSEDSIGDIDFEQDQFEIGIGWKNAMNKDTSLFAALNFVSLDGEISDTNFDSDFDDDGYSLEAGVRSMFTNELELGGRIKHTEVDFGDSTAFIANAAFYFTENFAVVGDVGVDDDSNVQYLLGARLAF